MARDTHSDRETTNAQQQTGGERKIDVERERWRVYDSTRQKDR